MQSQKIPKILLMGTPTFSVVVFKSILNAFPNFSFSVVSRPDAKKGRGLSLQPSPVSTWAIQESLPLYRPSCKEEATDHVLSFSPDLIIVVAYGFILQPAVVNQFYCINVHASLLPFYRGASPIQSALLSGESQTGITLIKMNEGMDEGDIIAIQPCSIEDEDYFPNLHDKLAVLASSLIHKTISQFFSDAPLGVTKQNATLASYCPKIQKFQYELFPNEDPLLKLRKIKAFYPFAFMTHQGKRIRILNATLQDKTLVPIKIQPEGKSEMLYVDYLRGHKQGFSI
jgi:methionyl-tRNA formyltransferase